MIKFKCLSSYLSKTNRFYHHLLAKPNYIFTIPRYYFAQAIENNTNDTIIDEGNNSNEEPKWMRFFHSSEVIKVDIERAVKSDSNELLNNYVKGNYMTFEYEHLIIAYDKLSTSSSGPRLIQEIKLRIIKGAHKETPNIVLRLFKAFRTNEDSFLTKYIMIALCKHFQGYSFEDQTDILNYMLTNNSINIKLLNEYLKNHEEKFTTQANIEDYYGKLDNQSLFIHLRCYNKIHELLDRKEFNKVFKREILDYLYIKLYELIEDTKSIAKKTSYFDLLNIFPSSLPNYLQPYQIKNLKIALATQLIIPLFQQTILLYRLYNRYNIDENFGLYMPTKHMKMAYKPLKYIFQFGDRLLVEKSCHLISNFILKKFDITNADKFDSAMMVYFAKFKIVDPNYFAEYSNSIWTMIKNFIKKQKFDSNGLQVIFHKWKLLSALNFEDVLKAIEWVDKPNIKNFKTDVLKIFEKELLDAAIVPPRLYNLVLRYQEMLSVNEKQELSKKVLLTPKNEQDNFGQSKTDTIALTDENTDDFDEIESTPIMLQVETTGSRRAEMDYLAILEDRFEKEGLFKLEFHDGKLRFIDTLIISKYFYTIENTAKLFVYGMMHEGSLPEIQKFFQCDENDKLFDVFGNVPKYLDNLIMIDALSKPYQKKLGPDFDIFKPEFRAKIYEFKAKIDNFVNKYQYKVDEFFEDISNQYQKALENKDKDNLTYTLFKEHEEFLAEYDKTNYLSNINRASYQQKIDEFNKINGDKLYIRNKLSFVDKFRIHNNVIDACISIKVLNSNVAFSLTSESQLKKIMARVLKKCSIPFHYNFTSFPHVVDFLLYPNQPNIKIIIQIIDHHKLLLGVENVLTYQTKSSNAYFEALGYKILSFRIQDYELDEQAFINKVKTSIGKAIQNEENLNI